jgi:hypothetical protein
MPKRHLLTLRPLEKQRFNPRAMLAEECIRGKNGRKNSAFAGRSDWKSPNTGQWTSNFLPTSSRDRLALAHGDGISETGKVLRVWESLTGQNIGDILVRILPRPDKRGEKSLGPIAEDVLVVDQAAFLPSDQSHDG